MYETKTSTADFTFVDVGNSTHLPRPFDRGMRPLIVELEDEYRFISRNDTTNLRILRIQKHAIRKVPRTRQLTNSREKRTRKKKKRF